MQVDALEIPDVKVVMPKRFGDDRGFFSETYNKKNFDAHAIPMDFVQDNESFSVHKYTVRGLHYQAPPYAQDKLVRVLKGAVLDVVVDVRTGSPTFGKWVGAELSAGNGKQLFCPKGFLHGFMTLEPETLVAYKVTDFYNGPADGSVYFASPELDIDWPAGPDEVVLSDKDKAAPPFRDFVNPF